MKDEFVTQIGVWGQRHYNYLKNHFPTVINVMRMKGTLDKRNAGALWQSVYAYLCARKTERFVKLNPSVIADVCFGVVFHCDCLLKCLQISFSCIKLNT